MLRRNHILIILFSITILAGCTGNRSNSKNDWLNFGIFANRPVTENAEMYVITLNTPALLASAQNTAEGLKISDEEKQKVLFEQAQFETTLAERFPEARVVYKYRLVLNAIAIFATSDVVNQMQNLPGVKAVEAAHPITRPNSERVKSSAEVGAVNSVNFIGGDQAHALGFTGKGMRVGIIDTGVDYTHKMLGGSGKVEDFNNTNPATTSNLFPNQKVIGGIDLAGSDFDAASPDSKAHLPVPDNNPIDEAGHGSHVAGTVAGRGDGVNTYDGIAPDASLYAIKVFGKDGSTADAIVIAGFEYAADPNGDLNINDRLDIVNLSLGSGFGGPKELYNAAIENIVRGGTIVVASAGNSGDISYIVGAPSTTDSAISVAASIDGAEVNWRFRASLISSQAHPEVYVQAVEGPASKPVAEADGIGGELVDIGFADTELSDEQKAKLNGKVAFIQRGKVNFDVKLGRAKEAGAIGVVIYNNAPADPIPMGGDEKFDFPAIMITQAQGAQITEDLKIGPVRIAFKTDHVIENPEKIDQITDFSSRGPRSEDNMFKPEIAAPGQNITSAEMGKGDKGVMMNGTSMAGPHVAGVMALLRQAHPNLSVLELKSIVMTTSKDLTAKDGVSLPLTTQGAGRVQLIPAIQAKVVSESPSISLGSIELGGPKSDTREIGLRNLTAQDVTYKITTTSKPGLEILAPASVSIPAHGETKISVQFNYSLATPENTLVELDGRINLLDGEAIVASIPAMGIRTEAAQIQAAQLAPFAGRLMLTNSSVVPGLAAAFNLLGEDDRKATPLAKDSWMSRSCDLRSVGYRIVKMDTAGGPVDAIEFGIKLQTRLTSWVKCSISVLIDKDGDGNADQELIAIGAGQPLEGVQLAKPMTLLLDSNIARQIRVKYEADLAARVPDAKPNYTPSVISGGPVGVFDQSTFALLVAPMEPLAKSTNGKLRIKVAAQAEDGQTAEADDFLGGELGDWKEIPATIEEQPFYNMPEATVVTSKGASLDFVKGTAPGKLVLYYPNNEINNVDDAGDSGQEQIIEIK